MQEKLEGINNKYSAAEAEIKEIFKGLKLNAYLKNNNLRFMNDVGICFVFSTNISHWSKTSDLVLTRSVGDLPHLIQAARGMVKQLEKELDKH